MTLFRPTTSNGTSAPLGAFGTDRGPHHSPRYHQGHDYPVGVGTPIYASGPGIVSTVVNTGRVSGFGLSVVVTQDEGYQVRNAHMSRVTVAQGDRVDASTLLGYTGGAVGSYGAGGSQGPHDHVEVVRNGVRLDPQVVLRPRSELASPNPPRPIEDDDMYTDADRARDEATNAAVGRIEVHAVNLRAEVKALTNLDTLTNAAVGRIEVHARNLRDEVAAITQK